MKECSKTTAIESMPLFLSPRKLAISSVSSISCSTIICKVDLKNKFQDFYPSFSFLLHSNFLRNLSSKYFFFKFSLDLQTKYYHISLMFEISKIMFMIIGCHESMKMQVNILNDLLFPDLISTFRRKPQKRPKVIWNA